MTTRFWISFTEAYKQLKSPMRPNASEIGVMERAVRGHVHEQLDGADARILLLGVTAGLVSADWPERTELTVVDSSDRLIGELWPGDADGRRKLVRGDWMNVPLPACGFHFVLGDGVFNLQDYPRGYTALAGLAASVLVPGGLMLVRVFIQPDAPERPEELVRLYQAGGIHDFQELRFRFLTALQGSISEGVASNPVTLDRRMEAYGICLEDLYAGTRNALTRVTDPTLGDSVHDLKVTYPTRRQFEEALAEHLSVRAVAYGEHPLARRCPIFSLAPINH